MSQTIYPIGIQNFEKIRKDGYLYIDKTAWSINWLLPDSITSSAAPGASGKACCCPRWRLFPRKEGAVRGTGHGEIGKRLDKIPHLTFGFKCGEIF